MMNLSDHKLCSQSLLDWYDANRRSLPWRAEAKQTADPYRVWLSEIMLQQTTVATVQGYFARFLERWPTLPDLAAAPLDDVLHAWAGLGYYARARNLHKGARAIVDQYGGVFPSTESSLRALPGIGDYTAAAIAAIAYNQPAAAVDGNVVRVISRVYALDAPLPGVRKAVHEKTLALVPNDRPGDFAQALMDLGAGVCRPRNPTCAVCPWNGDCSAKAQGRMETFPVRPLKKDKPTRRGIAFWLQREDGTVLLERRPEKGLLGGMMGVPTTPWAATVPDDTTVRACAPGRTTWRVLPGMVRHTFTHFHLELGVWAGHGPADRNDAIWIAPTDIDTVALPSVMKKVFFHVLATKN